MTACGMRSGHRGSISISAAIAVALAAAAAAAGWTVHALDERVDAVFGPASHGRFELYSAPFRIARGVDLEAARFRARLGRLGYRETSDEPLEPGTFRAGTKRVEIALRGFSDGISTLPPLRVRLDLDGPVVNTVSRLTDRRPLGAAWLEPERLGRYGVGTIAAVQPVRLEALPPHIAHAVLAAEDARFASHVGLDPIGIVRAAWTNWRAGGIRQGGSTITQQLAKNMMLDAERTWRRKIEEAALAVVIDFRVPKDDLLRTYLDTVYMGRIGSVPVHGITQAARGFFAKEPEQLTVGEAAALAGLIRAPNKLSPLRHPERARARRDQVLEAMAAQGWLDESDLARSRAQPLEVRRREPRAAPWFVDEALRQLARLDPQADPRWDPATSVAVFTTLDVELQRALESTVANEIAALEKRYPSVRRPKRPVEAGAVVIEARSGRVRALVGGRGESGSEFNHATRAKRQPGSAFKPFVYLAAIDAPEHPLTPASLLLDAPLRVTGGGSVWQPKNSDGRFVGRLTVRRALEQSRNVPAHHAAESVGRDRIRALAAEAGLGAMPDVPSLALGTGEVTLLDLTAAYGVFPNLGSFAAPTLIRSIRTGDGTSLYRAPANERRVATEASAYVVSHLLEGVVDRGTGRDIRRLGLKGALAGKTGTTDEGRDAWFVGYSPRFVTGIWVGFDDGRPLHLTASQAAIPVWVPVMRQVARIVGTVGSDSFAVPEGVVFREVEQSSGLLATDACPNSVREAFIAGTEPVETCETGRRRARSGSRGSSFWEEVGGFFKGLVGAD
jgi:1A family penicillin-binding protein